MRSSPCHFGPRHHHPASTSAKHVKISLGQGIFPSGQWELSRSLRHAHPTVDRSVGSSCASESRGKHVSHFPIGRWELLKSLRHAQPVVYRSVIRRCASENQSKCVSNFPIGAMGDFRSLQHVHIRDHCTIVDQSVRRSCASESKRASQQFSHRGDGIVASL